MVGHCVMMKTILLKRTPESRRPMRMIVSISLDMRKRKKLLAAVRFTSEEFCKAAERHGLTVNFSVAKTEALLVLRGAGKNKVESEIKGKTPQFKLLVKSSESWNSTSRSGAMGPGVSWRVDRTWVAYLAVAGRFFAAANPSLKCKKSVAATLLENTPPLQQ